MAGERTLPGLGLTGFWNLGSPYKDQMDENLRALSALVQCAVDSQQATEPATPAQGDRILLTGGANANSIAVYDDSTWVYFAPQAGWLCYDRATDTLLKFDGTAWSSLISDSLYVGTYTSESALSAAHPTALAGSYAHVDAGVGTDALLYIWDDDDGAWVQASSAVGAAVSIKDDGAVVNNAASILNFTGAGVTATDAGGGEATVDIPGFDITPYQSEAFKLARSQPPSRLDNNPHLWTHVADDVVYPKGEASGFVTGDPDFGECYETTGVNRTIGPRWGQTFREDRAYVVHARFKVVTDSTDTNRFRFGVHLFTGDTPGTVTQTASEVGTVLAADGVVERKVLFAADALATDINVGLLGADYKIALGASPAGNRAFFFMRMNQTPPSDAVFRVESLEVREYTAEDLAALATAAGASVSSEGAVVVASPSDINFTGAGVTVTDDGDGTVTVDIPGGGGGGGTSGAGDPLGFARFTRPGNIFTAEDTGTPDANAYVGADGTWVIRHVGNQGQSWAKTTQGITAGADFDVVFAINATQINDNFASLGVYVGQTSTNQRTAFHRTYNNLWQRAYWNGPATFEAGTTYGGEGPFGAETKGAEKFYLRLKRVGSTVTFYASTNGLLWVNIVDQAVSASGMTDIDHVGLFIDTNAVGAGIVTEIRCIGYDLGPQPEQTTGGTQTASGVLDKIDKTASYSVTDDDLTGNVLHKANSASTITITVPPGLTGTEPLTVVRLGAGDVTFAAGAGVTIHSAGGALSIAAQYGTATLLPLGGDTYLLFGDLG